jgi:hypothetical protein
VDDNELEGYECAREIIEKYKEIDPHAIYPYSLWSCILLRYAEDFFYDEWDKFEKSVKNGYYSRIEDVFFDVLFNGFISLEGKY